jgi:LL-diaminopimelate aminotransferase
MGIIKSSVDTGLFMATQEAGIAALSTPTAQLDQLRAIYSKRRDALVNGLNSLGWTFVKPKATFYIWSQVPAAYNSVAFADKLLNECGILVTPGSDYGLEGEGYIRFSLTETTARIEEALSRIKDHLAPIFSIQY